MISKEITKDVLYIYVVYYFIVCYLFKDEATFFNDTQRIFIVWEILRRTSFDDNQATGNTWLIRPPV